MEQIAARGVQDSDFEIYLFEGTPAELRPIVGLSKPERVEVIELDISAIVSTAMNQAEAREVLEYELGEVGTRHGQLVILASGLNLLASLYPEGLMQPLLRFLRASGRTLILVVPPAISVNLPLSAHLEPWRSAVALIIGARMAERTLVV